MATCENVAGCENPATHAVPMFMGSVWMCARCSVEFGLDIPPSPLMWTAPEFSEWERIDRDVWGLA